MLPGGFGSGCRGRLEGQSRGQAGGSGLGRVRAGHPPDSRGVQILISHMATKSGNPNLALSPLMKMVPTAGIAITPRAFWNPCATYRPTMTLGDKP